MLDAEFFQEKKGTSFGNAISNGAFPLWVAFDWSRYLTGQIVAGTISFSFMLFIKYFIALVSFSYGLKDNSPNNLSYFGVNLRKVLSIFSPKLFLNFNLFFSQWRESNTARTKMSGISSGIGLGYSFNSNKK